MLLFAANIKSCYIAYWISLFFFPTVALKRTSNKVFTIVRGVAADFQFIVQLVRIIALKQEETRSNKAIEMARRLA